MFDHNCVKIKNLKNDKIETIHIKELKKPLVTDVLQSPQETLPNTTT